MGSSIVSHICFRISSPYFVSPYPKDTRGKSKKKMAIARIYDCLYDRLYCFRLYFSIFCRSPLFSICFITPKGCRIHQGILSFYNPLSLNHIFRAMRLLEKSMNSVWMIRHKFFCSFHIHPLNIENVFIA
jgi:hypothetical protein